MVLKEFKPGYLLSELVRTYRLVQFEFKGNVTLPCKAYPPRAEHCLSFYPRDLENVEYAGSGRKVGNLRAVLFGQQTEVSNRFVGNNFLLFQIVFKPGGLFRLTGVPSHEFNNSYLDAEIVFSKDIKSINEKLYECIHDNEMVAIVESFLLKELTRKSIALHRMDSVNAGLFTTSSLPTVDAMAASTYLSTRQFERLFKERMGVSPKYYLKVLRFENIFRMKNTLPHLDWLSLAIHNGYYDYQHLVKDYKSFTQKTPTEFHQIDLSAPEREFGVADTF